jgi:hypothetical protein
MGIMIEHRASDICIEIVHHLRTLLPAPPADAALAVGATPTDELHALPSQMAAAVAREGGMRDTNFGGHAPVELLGQIALRENAKVVWLSVTLKPKPGIRAQVQRLADMLAEKDAMLVVGGAAADALAKHPHMHVLNSMSELSAFLEGMRNRQRG